MQVPETNYIIVRLRKDGGEETDFVEFTTHDDAVDYMNSAWESLSKDDKDKYECFYLDTVTWLHEV